MDARPPQLAVTRNKLHIEPNWIIEGFLELPSGVSEVAMSQTGTTTPTPTASAVAALSALASSSARTTLSRTQVALLIPFVTKFRLAQAPASRSRASSRSFRKHTGLVSSFASGMPASFDAPAPRRKETSPVIAADRRRGRVHGSADSGLAQGSATPMGRTAA